MVAVRKPASKRKRATTKKQGWLTRLNLKGVVLWLVILFFLAFTLTALLYVVFFHTVVVFESHPHSHHSYISAVLNVSWSLLCG